MKQLMLLIVLLISLFSVAQTKEEYYKKASEYADHKDYENALHQIGFALEKDSTNWEYLFLKANSLYQIKDFHDAFNVYSKIIRLYPDNAIALNQRGILLQTIQENEYSIKDFDKALSLKNIDTLRVSLLVNRGAAKINIRDFQGAYNDFFAAYKLDSLNIGTLNNLAAVCDEVGKGNETLGYLYKIIKIDSTFIGAYGNIGFKYQEMGDYKKAIQFFNKVLSLEPDEAISYNNRGYNRYKLGDLNGALADIEKSISIYPTNSYAFRNRALVFLAQKKLSNACADLEKAAELGFTKMYGNEVEELRLKNCMLKSL